MNISTKLFHNNLVLFIAAALIVFVCSSYYFSYDFNLKKYIITEYELSESCQCKRPAFYPSQNQISLNSTCSDVGTFFESRQNVISFSLHFPHPLDPNLRKKYLTGISENIARMRKFYPGFSMRLYTDESLAKGSDYCKIWCDNSEFFWCDVRHSPSLGNMTNKFLMLWRFVTLGDPTVDVFLIRDLDSVITPREVAAVNEWLTLDKPFHLMRDHLKHCIPVLGGMWGARNTLFAHNESLNLREQLLKTQKAYRGHDQEVLEQMLKTRKGDIIVHDSYCCTKGLELGKDMVLPFPTRRLNRNNDFVGNPMLGEGNWSLPPCPEECRPSYGKDWVYC